MTHLGCFFLLIIIIHLIFECTLNCRKALQHFIRWSVKILYAVKILFLLSFENYFCACSVKQRRRAMQISLTNTVVTVGVSDKRRNRAHHCCTGWESFQLAAHAHFAHQWAADFLSCRDKNEAGRVEVGENVDKGLGLVRCTSMSDTQCHVMLWVNMNVETTWHPLLLCFPHQKTPLVLSLDIYFILHYLRFMNCSQHCCVCPPCTDKNTNIPMLIPSHS